MAARPTRCKLAGRRGGCLFRAGLQLDKEFGSLDAYGTAPIASVFGRDPLIRSRNINLYVLAGFDDKEFEDIVGATSMVTKRSIEVGSLGFAGSHRDDIGGGGSSSYSVTAFAGRSTSRLPRRWPWTRRRRKRTARPEAGVQCRAVESVTEALSLSASVRGQVAAQNLDSSEKMDLGGPYEVRAYPVGEGDSDEGYVAHLEARLPAPGFSEHMPGQGHLIGFYDIGAGTISKDPWTNEDNHRTRAQQERGLRGRRQIFSPARINARKVGDESAAAPIRRADTGRVSRIFLTGVMARFLLHGDFMNNGVTKMNRIDRLICNHGTGAFAAIDKKANRARKRLAPCAATAMALIISLGSTPTRSPWVASSRRWRQHLHQREQHDDYRDDRKDGDQLAAFRHRTGRIGPVGANRQQLGGAQPGAGFRTFEHNGSSVGQRPSVPSATERGSVVRQGRASGTRAGPAASTRGITDADFMAGRYKIQRRRLREGCSTRARSRPTAATWPCSVQTSAMKA